LRFGFGLASTLPCFLLISAAELNFWLGEVRSRTFQRTARRAGAVHKTLLDKLATKRQRVIGFHLPFPGIGIVERSGSSYRFAPA